MRAIPLLLLLAVGCTGSSRAPGHVQTYDVSWAHYPELEQQHGALEQPPSIVGGLAGLERRLAVLDTPQRCPYSGEVIVQAVVDEQGRAVEAQLAQGIGEPCDEMALEVVRSSDFVPLVAGGKPQKVVLTFPIRYR